MAPRLVVLGWDSATFDVIDPLLAAGRLPNLAALVERGYRAPLRSTWPPMTDCAWTSAFTGRNPGAHGIFGSWYRAPGAYACRYFSSRDRRSPAVWELTEDPRFLVWNVPMTFPPDEVNGAMVAGYGAPPGSRFTAPADLQDRLSERWPLDDLLDRAPHGSLEGFLDDLLRGLEAQGEALPWAARETEADCVLAVWPHVDRAQHFFWRFRDTDHPLADAVDRVYEAMDAATGAVVEAFPDADVLVVSDHGAGPLHGDLNMGPWLAAHGHASYGKGKRSLLADVAWAMPAPLRRLGRRLAPGVARGAMAARLESQLAPFDWSQTRAFMGVHSDLWVNLQGREPQGTVEAGDVDELLDDISRALLAQTDPVSGRPVVAAVHRKETIYSGAALDLAPDLVIDTWSAGYRVAPGRGESEDVVVPAAPLAGVHASWSSDHRPVGILVGAGPRFASGTGSEANLYDVAPTTLALLEQTIPEGLDGKALQSALTPDFLAAHPIRTRDAAQARTGEGTYSEEEAAAVAAHLKDLGYIE